MTQLTVLEARKRLRPPMRQVDLAAASNVDQTYVSLLERCLRRPSDDVRKRLAKALKVAPSRLRFVQPQPLRSLDQSYDSPGHTVPERAS